jgi:hypothetical protein
MAAENFTMNNVDPLFHTFSRDDEECTPIDPKIVAEIEKHAENNDEDSSADEDEDEHDDDSGSTSEHSSDEED